MTVLESALYLAKRGFRVFPLKPNTKVPAITNFSGAATTDEEKINAWFGNGKNYNIGISTDDLLVVDVDTKDPAKNGLETISKLNAEGKIFPPTTQQVTTTKGMHLIYQTKCPVKNSVSKLGPGLDIRGKGGYIVAMGSSLNGLKYQINKRNTVDAPEWLHEACELDRGEVAHATEVAAVTDPDRAWARGLDYLARIELVSGGSRNIEAYKAANWLKDIGVTRPDCFYLMLEHWKCEPMLEPTELNAAISSAFKYGKEAQGSASPEAL